jgi:major membrane immunogen (membrane-anchored lipoprotein)
MKHIAASVTVAVPADLCYRAAERSYDDERWQGAYATLRPGKRYSGHVTAREPGRRLEITVGSIDGPSGAQMPTFGYRVTYRFSPEGERTRVEIAVEYETLLAVAGMGTMEGQAANEILHRLAAIVALEVGQESAVGVGSGSSSSSGARAS